MLEQEMIELTEHHGYDGRRRGRATGWSLLSPVWDTKGLRLLGCVRIESSGLSDEGGLAIEFEECPGLVLVG